MSKTRSEQVQSGQEAAASPPSGPDDAPVAETGRVDMNVTGGDDSTIVAAILARQSGTAE